MNADAWLYGTTTTKEFTDFQRPVIEEICEVPEGDFIVDAQAELYYISVDVNGEIGWKSGTFRNRGTPAHVIEALTALSMTMQSELQSLEAFGIPTKFHSYDGLPHGFGIETGTIAEGWIHDAAAFGKTQYE